MKGQLLHKVFHTLTEAFQNCLRRFPSTVCFVLALTVYLVYLVATDMDDDRKLVMVLGYYFSIGTLLSLTLHLWSEEIKSKIKEVDLFKKLDDTDIWEFRTFYNKTKYRLLAFWDKDDKINTLVIATHGFIKKTQKTPPKEIAKAEEIRKDYFNSKR